MKTWHIGVIAIVIIGSAYAIYTFFFKKDEASKTVETGGIKPLEYKTVAETYTYAPPIGYVSPTGKTLEEYEREIMANIPSQMQQEVAGYTSPTSSYNPSGLYGVAQTR